MRTLRRHLTYANVMATIAVFLALGGISWAAVKLPRNSVGPAQIKKNAITGAKVKNGSLTASDLRKGTLRTGPQGPAGPTGAAGPQGPAGPVEVTARLAPNAPVPLPNGGAFVTLAARTLTPGSWVVIAKTVLLGAATSMQSICQIDTEDGDIAQNVTSANRTVPVTLTSVVTVSAATTVALTCNQNGGTGTSAAASRFVAFRASSAAVDAAS